MQCSRVDARCTTTTCAMHLSPIVLITTSYAMHGAAPPSEAERTPVWLMRQAGRYMAAFREYSDKYPFRMRSETPEIAIELSLQVGGTFAHKSMIIYMGSRGAGPRCTHPTSVLGPTFDRAPSRC